MQDCLPKDLPDSPGSLLQKKTGKSPSNQFPYREAVGSLLYLGLASHSVAAARYRSPEARFGTSGTGKEIA